MSTTGNALPVPGRIPRTRWRIQLLGAFAVHVDDVRVEAGLWRLRKAKLLVALLALTPVQRRRRDYLLDRLWPDLEPFAAAKNLHQTLYVARHAIAGPGTPTTGLLAIRDEQVALDDDGPVSVDVMEFELAARDALSSGDETKLRAAAGLYTGDLLPDWPDIDWLSALRRESRATHRELLIKLATTMVDSAPEEALINLAGVLDADPLHEGAVRAQMVVLTRLGRRSEALARYERLVDGLLEAFGTDPDIQTAALFRGLLTGSPAQQRPRPAARATTMGHLPAPLTSFVGRQREIIEVERLLGQTRLLTLTGAGGSGKTRLGVEAARRVRARYADGAGFVDLSAVRESLFVVDAVAEALGLDFAVVGDRGQSVVDQLRGRSLLLVLDNCEQVLTGCSNLVAALLSECPGVAVLATSREPLHAHGEYTLRVPSLALPLVWDETADLDELAALSSVRLFVERAAQARPGFALDAGNARGVVELCRRLDGMPLALELAAARVAVLEPSEIVARLSDALSLLSGGPNSITRHETLRGTLEWSHNLLTEPEQILLRRLSVFPASFTLESLEAVCGGPPLEVAGLFDLLAKLVDKSLVVPVKTATRTRYRQLETVRQFYHGKLDMAGEADLLSAAHAAYFLAFAVAHNPERALGVVKEQPKLVDREHDNLRAALRWACVHDSETALRLAASLWRFWFMRGHAVEGARWVERALAVAPQPTRSRAAALIGLTGLDSRQGRSDRYRSLGAEAVAVVKTIGDADEVTMAQIVEAMLVWSAFELDDAEQMAADVRADAIGRGRPEYTAAGSWLLAHCALFREDGPLALRHLDACLSELACSDMSARPFLPVITPCIQLIPLAGRSVPFMEETMLLGRRVGVAQAMGYVVAAMGYAHRLSGDQHAAVSSVADAADRFEELGDDLARAQALHQIGCIYRDTGNYPAAERALSDARDLRIRLGDRRGELLTEVNVALLKAVSGDIRSGLDDARRSFSGFEAAGDPVGMGAALTVLGAIELVSGEIRAAREMYRRAAERFTPWPRFSAWLHLVVAELSIELDDELRMEREITAAATVFDRTACIIAGRRLAGLRSHTAGGSAHSGSR